RHRVGHAPGDDLDDLSAEPRAALVDPAAEVQLVHGVRGAADGLGRPVPADVGDVVLAARVGAAADLDDGVLQPLGARHVGQIEPLGNGTRDVARAGHGQVARLGAGARGDVFGRVY